MRPRGRISSSMARSRRTTISSPAHVRTSQRYSRRFCDFERASRRLGRCARGLPMSTTKPPQGFRTAEGKKYQLGRLAMSFKRTEGEDEGSYSLFETAEPVGA